MKIFQLLLLLLLSFYAVAQESQPLLIIGTEMGIDFRKFEPLMSQNPQYTAGVTMEYPYRKFSIGTGLIYKVYGAFNNQIYTGYSAEEVIDEEIYTFYYYEEERYDLEYYGIPLRLQYRLPCNCVYLQAGVHIDIANFTSIEEGSHQLRTIQEPADFHFDRDEALKRLNLSYELAIGFKLHFNDQLRMFMRPTYRIMASPTNKNSVQLNTSYRQLHMAFGLQYAI